MKTCGKSEQTNITIGNRFLKLLEWKISPTFSQIRDNDLRETPYLMSISAADTSYSIDVSNVGNPTRMWRFLDEVNM